MDLFLLFGIVMFVDVGYIVVLGVDVVGGFVDG